MVGFRWSEYDVSFVFLFYFISVNSKVKAKSSTYQFKVGDTVRIWGERLQFHRGYMENFTCEFFIITKVLRNLPFPRYNLKEYKGDEIIGTYFEDELVKYQVIYTQLKC